MKTTEKALFEFKSDGYRAMRGKSDGEWFVESVTLKLIQNTINQSVTLVPTGMDVGGIVP